MKMLKNRILTLLLTVTISGLMAQTNAIPQLQIPLPLFSRVQLQVENPSTGKIKGVVEESSLWNIIIQDKKIDNEELALLDLIISDTPQIRLFTTGNTGERREFIFNNQWKKLEYNIIDETASQRFERKTSSQLLKQYTAAELGTRYPTISLTDKPLYDLSKNIADQYTAKNRLRHDYLSAILVKNYLYNDKSGSNEPDRLLNLFVNGPAIINIKNNDGSNFAFLNLWDEKALPILKSVLRMPKTPEGEPDWPKIISWYRDSETASRQVVDVLAKHIAGIKIDTIKSSAYAAHVKFSSSSFNKIKLLKEEKDIITGRIILHDAYLKAQDLLPAGKPKFPKVLYSWIKP